MSVLDDELSLYVLKLNSNYSQGPCQPHSISAALKITEPASQLLSYIHGHAFLSVTTAQALKELPQLTGKSCLLFSRLLPAEQKIEPDVEALAAAYTSSSNTSAADQEADAPSSEDEEQGYAAAIQDGAALITIIIPKSLAATAKALLSTWQTTADDEFGASLDIIEEESAGVRNEYVNLRFATLIGVTKGRGGKSKVNKRISSVCKQAECSLVPLKPKR